MSWAWIYDFHGFERLSLTISCFCWPLLNDDIGHCRKWHPPFPPLSSPPSLPSPSPRLPLCNCCFLISRLGALGTAVLLPLPLVKLNVLFEWSSDHFSNDTGPRWHRKFGPREKHVFWRFQGKNNGAWPMSSRPFGGEKGRTEEENPKKIK